MIIPEIVCQYAVIPAHRPLLALIQHASNFRDLKQRGQRPMRLR
jgi:hypothetical protein